MEGAGKSTFFRVSWAQSYALDFSNCQMNGLVSRTRRWKKKLVVTGTNSKLWFGKEFDLDQGKT